MWLIFQLGMFTVRQHDTSPFPEHLRVQRITIDFLNLDRNQKIMVAVLLSRAILVILNATLLSPALPHIMRDTGVDATTAQWLTSTYSLVEAVVIPLNAFFVGRFSTRRYEALTGRESIRERSRPASLRRALLAIRVVSLGCLLRQPLLRQLLRQRKGKHANADSDQRQREHLPHRQPIRP